MERKRTPCLNCRHPEDGHTRDRCTYWGIDFAALNRLEEPRNKPTVDCRCPKFDPDPNWTPRAKRAQK